MKKVKRNILLNPGPATTSDTVKLAQVVPDICPREKEFGDVMKFIAEELTTVVANTDDYTSVLFGGSGTAAVESVLCSVINDDETILIINNGAYGKRMVDIAKVYGLDYLEYKSSLLDPIDYNDLDKYVQGQGKSISFLAIVHNETTAGLLNNLEQAKHFCEKHNSILIVDAMSSYAAIPIDMIKQNIGFLTASSNKNIQGMAGISFVIAKNSYLENSSKVKPSCYYLNLYLQYEYFKKNYQMRFTPPVQTIYALKQAIIEAKKESVEGRYARYSKSWETLVTGLEKLGLKVLVDKKYHSKIICTIKDPDIEGFDFDEMHDYLYERGYTIYPGKMSNLETFRIANIGDIDYKDIKAFLKILGAYLELLRSACSIK
jgi:2-aminoethylphosphonate-pyruvate transaminase